MENPVFAIRPRPLPGESLWSYLLRLANQNGLQLLTLLNARKTWEIKYIQRADFGLLDIAPGRVLDMVELSNLTGQSLETMLNATFAPLLRTFGASEEVQRARFLSGMILDRYRFCPLCLKEASYSRLLWKMSPITSCVQHGVVLEDKCPSCDKLIRFQDIERLDVCPHCGGILTNTKLSSVADNELAQQKWVHEALGALLTPESQHIDPSEVAMRLLYLLCGTQPHFDRKLAEAKLPTVLPTLLQHARGSLSQQRTLHLSFLLNTLYAHTLSMHELLKTRVPKTFVDSIRQRVIRKADKFRCQAPWCIGSQYPGKLVKTGTTLKRRKSGETLLYYLACTECGCEYAVTEDDRLQERTYFIEGYQALRQSDVPLTGIKLLARRTGFTEDKTRRCLAYFSTRLDPDEWSGTRCEVDVPLLELVLNNIRKGTKLKTIQQWDCWDSYQQFLIYRFHPEVMRALIELKRPRPTMRSTLAIKREKVRETLDVLLERDEDITIEAVCRIVGVCPETIRSWGCNSYIAKVKELQTADRRHRMKEHLYQRIDTFFAENSAHEVRSNDVYDYLGIGRTLLWRIAPEIASHVGERIEQQNTGSTM